MFRRRITEAEKTARAAKKLLHASEQRECQICERKQCLTSKSLLVLHGYERPGHGFINGSCFGVGFVDYGHGTDALSLYLTSLNRMLFEAEAHLLRFVRGQVTHFETVEHDRVKDARGHTVYVGRRAQTVPRFVSWAPGVSDRAHYESHLKSKHAEASTRVTQLEAESLRVTKRIAAYVPTSPNQRAIDA